MEEEENVVEKSKARKQPASTRYQAADLGKALLLSLKSMMDEGSLSKEEAHEIMAIYDESMEDVMKAVLENVDEVNNSARFEGTLQNFNSYRGYWHFDAKGSLASNTGTDLRDVQFRVCFTDLGNKYK